MIARVGNTGRATNDHLHLEIHVAQRTRSAPVVDSLERFPPYTTNPELWIEPLPGTGIVAGRVLDAAGAPVPQRADLRPRASRSRGKPRSRSPRPTATGRTPHPLYGEHFAVSDVPPGTYVLGTEIAGKRVFGG